MGAAVTDFGLSGLDASLLEKSDLTFMTNEAPHTRSFQLYAACRDPTHKDFPKRRNGCTDVLARVFHIWFAIGSLHSGRY